MWGPARRARATARAAWLERPTSRKTRCWQTVTSSNAVIADATARRSKPNNCTIANSIKTSGDVMAEKHPDTKREGGPGASHENRKEPEKSKPHARLNDHHPEQGNTHRNAQGKSGGDGRE